MKRLLSIILALMLFAVPALGEELDLSAMSIEELTSLSDKIDAELIRRGEETQNGYSGVFVGGKNIKPGSYNIVCLDDEVLFVLWKSEDAFGAGRYESQLYEHYSKGDRLSIYFDEGTVVQVDGTVSIQQATEDWVPEE